MAVVKLTAENFDKEVIQADQPVLVDFYADWCVPCQMMGPVVEEIANETTDIKVCKLNTSEQMEIAERFHVMTIPTFMVFKNGESVGKQIGAVSKSALLDLVK